MQLVCVKCFQRRETHCLAVHLQVRLQEREAEAVALKAALASAQKAAQQTERDPGPEAAASGSSASLDLQLKTAWDRANALKQRYLEAQAACTSFKQQNSKILQVSCAVGPTSMQSCMVQSLPLQAGVPWVHWAAASTRRDLHSRTALSPAGAGGQEPRSA